MKMMESVRQKIVIKSKKVQHLDERTMLLSRIAKQRNNKKNNELVR